jgi:hypothetical protein
VARQIAQKDKIQHGLVCVLGCVEPSRSFKVGPNRKTKELELRAAEWPCLHVYFYWIDREFGLIHVRLQTWLPFMAWIQMRRGLADIARRALLCRNANERYLEALSVVGEVLPSHKVLDPISKRLCRHGRSYRPLHPISPDDAKLFRVICSGEFLLHDFRNKDLRRQLYPQADKTPVFRRQASGRIFAAPATATGTWVDR